MKYLYAPAVYESQEAPELQEGYYAVLLEEDAERQHKALRNCLLLAMRNLHVKHPDSLAAKNWEAILRFCKEGGVEPSPLRAEMETSALCPHGMPLAENVCGPCSEGQPNTWRCMICNLLNPGDANHCRQCEYSRTVMRDGKRVPRDGQR